MVRHPRRRRRPRSRNSHRNRESEPENHIELRGLSSIWPLYFHFFTFIASKRSKMFAALEVFLGD